MPRWIVLATPLILGLTLTLAPREFSFYGFGPYDDSVPKPEKILGYEPGENHTNFRDQELVYAAIHNAAPKRTMIREFGKSWEGRPLRIFVVSSEKNVARLEEIRKQMNTLATGSAEAAKLVDKLPSIVWVNQTVHGNESASFESGMWLAYTLTASRNADIKKALDDVVVIINPVFNPDGHERFAVWNRSVAVSSPDRRSYEYSEPDWVHGRTNHFRFDMNRDRVAMSQAETIAEAAELRRWYPQVYLDQHGQTSEYFFPPNSMSVNVNADRERIEKWTQVFGRAYAKEFDKHGWLYFTRDTFDFYYPGYLDTYSTYLGAIGMTHETDGGRNLNGTKNDGTPLTVRGGMAKHFTTAIASVKVAAQKRKELLESFYSYRRKGATGEHSGDFKRIVVEGGPRELQRLKSQLERAGIESFYAERNLEQPDATSYLTGKKERRTFERGSLVIDMAQPMGQFAKVILEPGQNFEKEFTKEQLEVIARSVSKEPNFGLSEEAGFYDATGWSPIYGHNLTAYWCSSSPKVDPAPSSLRVVRENLNETKIPPSQIGWRIKYDDFQDAVMAFRLADSGIRVRVMQRDVKVEGMAFEKGDFVVFRDRNEEDVESRLKVESQRTGSNVDAIPNGFSESLKGNLGIDAVPIAKPKVAVVFGNDEWTSNFGHTWFVMEKELGIPFTPLHADALSRDLDGFTCILFPGGRYGAPSEKLKEWIREGGCAVVQGGSWAIGEKKLFELEAVKLEEDKEIHYIPGAVFSAELDDRSFLANGYGKGMGHKIPFPIQVEGSSFYKAPEDANPVVAFPKSAGSLLLSGWSWPDNSEKALAGAVAVVDVEMGRGRAIGFAWDPCERAMWPGQYKLLMNAVLLGAN